LTFTAAMGDAEPAVRLPSPAHALRTTLALLGTTLVLAAPCGAPARAAREVKIEDVEESLARDSSFKVRVEAALILGRLHQVRSVPALVGALKDPEPGVRAAAAESLGEIGSPLPREALVTALGDPEPPVRRAARTALRRLGSDEGAPEPGQPDIRRHAGPTTSFEVKPIGDPGHHAGPVLQSHMRDFLIDQLRPFGDVEPGDRRGMYAVDGVIKSLSVETTGRDVEVSCAVQLVVSKQPAGGVFLLTSGQATVQKPKRQFRPQLRPSMEMEALEAAVRGASEDLVAKLARR
jgi:HEAT repeat protein